MTGTGSLLCSLLGCDSDSKILLARKPRPAPIATPKRPMSPADPDDLLFLRDIYFFLKTQYKNYIKAPSL